MVASEQDAYSWVMCPKCSPSNPTVWKHGDPGRCWRCGSATVNADHLKRPMPWEDERHGQERGYRAGCRLECCEAAHRATFRGGKNDRRVFA